MMLYVSNWGGRRLLMKFPSNLVSYEELKEFEIHFYRKSMSLTVSNRRNHFERSVMRGSALHEVALGLLAATFARNSASQRFRTTPTHENFHSNHRLCRPLSSHQTFCSGSRRRHRGGGLVCGNPQRRSHLGGSGDPLDGRHHLCRRG